MPELDALSQLSDWTFSGELRAYQREVLDQVPAGGDSPLHIVAPPGSGKTLLGLLLAMREGAKALVLVPTVTIGEQWLSTAATLTSDASRVSDDPGRIADLTVLTYQRLSVTGDTSPFASLARGIWVDELAAAGSSEADAATFLAALEIDNPHAYARGVRRRAGALRKRAVHQDPERIAGVLHPNAVALLDEIVEAGVRTLILDECHHLLDHWALVIAYLEAKIRRSVGTPRLIGLTATLPSADDGAAFENYSALLGPVDYEVPTPAVVKEGHLAPYRDLVWFTEPIPPEATFIRRHETLLRDLVLRVLSTPDGQKYLESTLQPRHPDDSTAGDLATTRLDRALSTNFSRTRVCAVVLSTIAPDHPLLPRLPTEFRARCTTDDLLTALARFAMDVLLPDPSAREQWNYLRRSLADFGLHLTDRGIRRGRDPIEKLLSHSAAKDHAAGEILRLELEREGSERLRCVIVTDFVEHGNHEGLAGEAAAGAVRTFDLLASDPQTAALSPVLLTSRFLRVSSADAETIASELALLLGDDVTVAGGGGASRDLQTQAGQGKVVAAVSELIRRGRVRVLVGTRGLLGEGWDCPAVNTLIDLTSVASASATQQLRGRTLRLDPAWPTKVAHNWSVTCLIPAHVDLDEPNEMRRLTRKHSHLFGLSYTGGARIVTGLDHALPTRALQLVRRVVDKDPLATIEAVNHLTAQSLASRAQTHSEWRIGQDYVSRERESLAITPQASSLLAPSRVALRAAAPRIFLPSAGIVAATLATASAAGAITTSAPTVAGLAIAGGAAVSFLALGRALTRTLRNQRTPSALPLAAAVAVGRTLRDARRIAQFHDSDVSVRMVTDHLEFSVMGFKADRVKVTDALAELFGPTRTPRFLLEVDRGAFIRSARPDARVYLPVPALIGRRRGDAGRFEDHWATLVGPCSLHELSGASGLAMVSIARSAPLLLAGDEPRARRWG